MRFQNWDVLLFPSAAESNKPQQHHPSTSDSDSNATAGETQIPLREFLTRCFTEPSSTSTSTSNAVVPLLTTFVPSLEPGRAFRVSVHSWKHDDAWFVRLGGKKEACRVKIVIDGREVARRVWEVESESVDEGWPRIVDSKDPPSAFEFSRPLEFPVFHREILAQSTWQPGDRLGRIRVELAAGYVDLSSKSKGFVKVAKVVNFAFQPAPLALLEAAGIAWPNPRMYAVPGQIDRYTGLPSASIDAATTVRRKKAGVGHGLVQQPFSANLLGQSSSPPFVPYTDLYDPNGLLYNDSSRSSSAYSNFSDSAGPLLYKAPEFFSNVSEGPAKQQLSFRLPSDQLQKIIHAIQPTQNAEQSKTTMMPPPPLPAHILASKALSEVEKRNSATDFNNPPRDADLMASLVDRRDSRFSDISMHAGCTSFPSCTSEDADGQIVHNGHPADVSLTQAAPSTVVRGRKEGSSPTKARDFFSTILDSTSTVPMSILNTPVASSEPAQPQQLFTPSSPDNTDSIRKRTRSALRNLNANNGSPERRDPASRPRPRKVSRSSNASSKSNKENSKTAGASHDMAVDL